MNQIRCFPNRKYQTCFHYHSYPCCQCDQTSLAYHRWKIRSRCWYCRGRMSRRCLRNRCCRGRMSRKYRKNRCCRGRTSRKYQMNRCCLQCDRMSRSYRMKRWCFRRRHHRRCG